MKIVTLKNIKTMVKSGTVLDITSSTIETIPEALEPISLSFGVYGMTGGLFRGTASGTLYAVTNRVSILFQLV